MANNASELARFKKVEAQLHVVVQSYRYAVREINARLEYKRTSEEVEALTRLKKKLLGAQKVAVEIAGDFIEAMS